MQFTTPRWCFPRAWTCVRIDFEMAVICCLFSILFSMAWQKVVFLTTVGCVLTYAGCVMQERWIAQNRVWQKCSFEP